MAYRVYYYFARSQEALSSASAMQMPARTIREQLLPRLQSEDDYLGIIDGQDNILQILYEPCQQRYWVEIPIDAAKASYGCHMTYAEIEELVGALPPVLDQQCIPGLTYRPW